MDSKRTVVITGAGGGIGALLVERFLENGDSVIATDNSRDALSHLRQSVAEASERLQTVAADVTDPVACQGVADAAPGPVDVLVNCAGFFPIEPFEEITPERWREVIDINLTGTFLMTRAVVPLMKASGRGRLINFGSGSVFDGTKNQAHYVAAKAGIVGLTRSLARELGAFGITANVITPGLTVTPAVRDSFPAGALEAQRTGRALQRDEDPADLVGPVFFLASGDAAFITGQTINVDGGKSMR